MLFLGLGTGLGSALTVDNRLEPMELAYGRIRRLDASDGPRHLRRRDRWDTRATHARRIALRGSLTPCAKGPPTSNGGPIQTTGHWAFAASSSPLASAS
jgi:hypothetical protein